MDKPTSPGESNANETVHGIKADAKTLEQLSSSGKAAQEKRDENQKERMMGALDSAIKEHFQGGGNKTGSEKK